MTKSNSVIYMYVKSSNILNNLKVTIVDLRIYSMRLMILLDMCGDCGLFERFPLEKFAHTDMDIGTAAYLYALRATPSAPRQTMDLVSVSRVCMSDRECACVQNAIAFYRSDSRDHTTVISRHRR